MGWGRVVDADDLHRTSADLAKISPLPRAVTRLGAEPRSQDEDIPGEHQVAEALEVGGVIVNDAPTYPIDHLPYGGVKDSGPGRDGLRWTIEDMTEIRIMALAWPQ